MYLNMKSLDIKKGGDTDTPAKFDIYKDAKFAFCGRLIASNRESVANSCASYKSKCSAKIGIESVKKDAASATIEDKV